MADVNIPDLTAASALTGAEPVECVQGGVNKQTTTAKIASLQIVSTNDANPNTATLKPGNLNAGALFYQDPSITPYNVWTWSIANQNWVQVMSP